MLVKGVEANLIQFSTIALAFWLKPHVLFGI